MALRGEYWIFPDGNSCYCDGDADITTPNHRMVACAELFRRLEFDLGEDEITEEQHAHTLFEEEVRIAKPWRTSVSGRPLDRYLQEVYARRVQPTLEDYLASKLKTYSRVAFQREWNGLRDPVEHALHYWGWQRIHDNYVETWTLTRKNLGSLANGLWDIYQDEAETATYYLEVRSCHRTLCDVPYKEIESQTAYRRLHTSTNWFAMQLPRGT